MKSRTLLALALTLASPVALGLAAPRAAHADAAKDASPAKRETEISTPTSGQS